MDDTSQFSQLVGGYFHQDVFDIYADEFEAIDDFVAADPAGSTEVPRDIERLLVDYPDESELQAVLTGMGAAIGPGDLTYRAWLTKIAEHVRAALGGKAAAD